MKCYKDEGCLVQVQNQYRCAPQYLSSTFTAVLSFLPEPVSPIPGTDIPAETCLGSKALCHAVRSPAQAFSQDLPCESAF